MKRFLVVIVLVGVLALATAAVASAGFTWCLSDPNIKLPDGGGVAHLLVSVPEEYKDAGLVIDVWAPAGSRVVSTPGRVAVSVNLYEGQANQITAQVAAGFPVRLEVKYRGDMLGVYEFENGSGTAEWSW